MSVSRQESAEQLHGQIDGHHTPNGGRQVIVAWLAITVGVALLFGLSRTESPSHTEETELHRVSPPGAEGAQWVRRVRTGSGPLPNGVASFEFINQTKEPVERIEIVVREVDSNNRLVRNHQVTADNLTAGQKWGFEVRPQQSENVLAVTEVKMR